MFLLCFAGSDANFVNFTGLLPQTSNNTSVTIKPVATCHLHADLLQLFNIACSEPVVNKL